MESRVSADVLAHHARYAGRKRSVIGLPSERRASTAEQLARGRVREKNRLRVDQRDLGQRVGDCVEQPAVGVHGRRRQSARDEPPVCRDRAAIHRRGDVDERAQAAVDGDALGLLAGRQKTVQIVAQPLDFSDVGPARAGPDERARSSTTTSAASAMIGSARSCVMRSTPRTDSLCVPALRCADACSCC